MMRLVVFLMLFFWILGLVMAIGRPETGVIEDAVLVALAGGLFALAISVRRLLARLP